VTLARRLAVVAVAALALSGAAVAATGDPQLQLDPADQAWTGSIILNATDVGAGWKGSGSAGPMTAADIGASGSCSAPDMSDLVMTGGTYSPDFYRNDGAYVAAGAVSWQTAEQAAANWSRSFQPTVLGCLARDLQAAGTKQVKVVVTGKRQLAWPTFGERSIAYRISLVFKGRTKVRKKWRPVTMKATADFLAIGAGRAEAMLWTFSFDAHPLTDFSQQKWALLMAQRLATPPAG
jgi:hypothetical protein